MFVGGCWGVATRLLATIAEPFGGKKMDKKHSKVSVGHSQRSSRTGSRLDGSLSRASRSLIGSKSSLFSSSRKNLASESMRMQKSVAQIFDDDGRDVTPQSLLHHVQPSLKKNHSNSHDSGTPTDSIFQNSIYGTGLASTSFSQPFSRSVFSSSMTDLGTVGPQDSMTEDLVRVATKAEDQQPTEDEEQQVYEEPRVLTEEDLEKEVNITLTETETIWMLDLPPTCVALDTDEAEDIKQRNDRYQELLKNRPGNDLYSDRGMQTINDATKGKQIQTDEVVKTESGMTTSTWDMYDTYEALKEAENAIAGKTEEETLEELSSRATSRMASGTSHRSRSRAPTAMGVSTIMEEGSSNQASCMYTMSVITENGEQTAPAVSRDADKESKLDPTLPNDHPILKLESLKDSLRIAERAVTQNIFQPKQAMYRNLPVIIDPDHPVTESASISLPSANLVKLWSFSCPLTKKRKVTCMAWNPLNKDIVAVGYGSFSASEPCVGLVCCWSLKNPQYPERIYHASSGITYLSFSYIHPNLLAAGLFSGSIVLYNVRSTAHESVLDSKDALDKHSAPVWQVGWVVKESSMGENKVETLVSISVDGRILQWSIRKGFESTQLMKLKRLLTPKPQQKKIKSKHNNQSRVKPVSIAQPAQGYISQHAPGMGFDFSPRDANIYLVSTEEGFIHKCSCSYNEQVLETYSGHTGPVYRVYWSPFVESVFLSCSADWSVKIWHEEHTAPLYSFHASQKAIHDVCWSPSCSTMFGCVSECRIEIWDLEHSVLDPLITQPITSGATQTCISFAHNAEVVLVGDAQGKVSVYLMKNIPKSTNSPFDALWDVVKSSSVMDFNKS